jgi:transposase
VPVNPTPEGDAYAYLKDVLARLPAHLNSQIEELLPHRWQPQS